MVRQGTSDMSKVWSGFAVTRTSRELGHRDSVADSTSSILPITFQCEDTRTMSQCMVAARLGTLIAAQKNGTESIT